MRRIFIILFFLFFISCKRDKKQEAINCLTGSGGKYWDVVYEKGWYNKSVSKTYPYYSYGYNKNGNCYFFKYIDNKRVIYDDGDVIVDTEWHLCSDSMIMSAGGMTKILKLTPDTFIYKYNNDTTILVKSQVK